MMSRLAITAILVLSCSLAFAQQLAPLTVEKIMRDPKWIGTSPSSPQWSPDGKTLFFEWNPEKAESDSLYYVTLNNTTPVKASLQQKRDFVNERMYTYNQNKTAFVYSKDGDIYYQPAGAANLIRITRTSTRESNPQFSFNEKKIVFTSDQNLYSWDIASGITEQLTNFSTGASSQRGAGRDGENKENEQDQWLRKDQLETFDVLRERNRKRKLREAYEEALEPEKMRELRISGKFISGMNLSPDGRYVSYRLSRQNSGKRTIVPDYVTESGYTEDLNTRQKVGAAPEATELYIYDLQADTVYNVRTDSVVGIRQIAAYFADYPAMQENLAKKDANRPVMFSLPSWSPDGAHAIIEIRSIDNKDRWLMGWDKDSRNLRLINRETNDAWIGGPGSRLSAEPWIDNNNFWYQSEQSGYSHVYIANMNNGQSRQVTSGNFEVQNAQLSKDKKYLYITSNEVHPGEKHFYRLNLANGQRQQLTTMTGNNTVALSPDESQMAILHSYSNKPTELYLAPNPAVARRAGAAKQITDLAQSAEFKSYPWRDPEVMSFKAADGANVYARIYKPENPHPDKPAVLFVHGAGYLQNAHKWWSSYFREYMFHNLLADNGYYVMDIDYRGSAGYGRDWRTGIYRHMGGKDLSDHVDAAKYLVDTYGVNPGNIGLYGGSYGGFITLMAMFTEPDVFAAGASLRPVTDWAQYNHGYTANILNTPIEDSIAYRKSSPLYYADGLKGHLLICHGVVDVNVHFQDAVKLSQRLIELGKDNWELAIYPMEDHGFVEPSSWTDEYKRIYKLFETALKPSE